MFYKINALHYLFIFVFQMYPYGSVNSEVIEKHFFEHPFRPHDVGSFKSGPRLT